MPTFAHNLDVLLSEILPIPDPRERLSYLMERAGAHPPLPPEERLEPYRVSGCISSVWLLGRQEGDAWRFRTDADSPMVRGLAWLYRDLYEGLSTAEILANRNTLLRDLGLANLLSGTRLQGLAALDTRFRQIAGWISS